MLIGVVARMANLSKDGVRHYEQMGLIASAPRTAGRRVYRDYDPSTLEIIENIRQLQQLGFALKEIGPLFKAYAAAAPVANDTMINFLEARLTITRQKIASLVAVEQYICRKLNTYHSEATPPPLEVCSAPFTEVSEETINLQS